MKLSRKPTKFLLSAVVLAALTACDGRGDDATSDAPVRLIPKADSTTGSASTLTSTLVPYPANRVAVDGVETSSAGGAFAPPVAAD